MKRTGGGHDDGARERRRGGSRGGNGGRKEGWESGEDRKGRMEGKGRKDETHFLCLSLNLSGRRADTRVKKKNWRRGVKRGSDERKQWMR